MTTTQRDVVSGAIFGGGAVALYVHASGFPVRQGQPIAVSPGFYPRLLAVILAVLAVTQIATALIASARQRAAGSADGTVASQLPPWWKDRRAFALFSLTLAALVVYPFLMRLVGFSLTGVLFIGVLVYALSQQHRTGKGIIAIALVTIGLALLTYVVFRLFLQIPFPTAAIRFR